MNLRPHTRPLLIAMTALLFLASCAADSAQTDVDLAGFCAKLPRAAYAEFSKDARSDNWFEVYEVRPGIWAIYEPWQWQEVISYLIVGPERALLFDTGNGIGDIKAVVDKLTGRPVTVLNSHSHYDHVGGNCQFDRILSLSTEFSIARSKGTSNADIRIEVSPDALCKGLPAGVTPDSHVGRPYRITDTVKEGDVIDLGNRKLEILRIPGHTDDAIALLDRSNGLLWTGDSFYMGPVWLYAPETDLAAYRRSLARLADLAGQLTALLPAHNTPIASPAKLIEARDRFATVLAGKAQATPAWEGVVTFEFDGFGFLMREDYTTLPESSR
jgi:glyoxylase-like metal-dependent hydrolase (beta-lactamase superfamily II)